ncbi:MAG: M48 family metallopeptidase [Gammaproteobacteria bacterium]|nr:M48 family metallopeptidase [Gammaproteobacteria bacterium]
MSRLFRLLAPRPRTIERDAVQFVLGDGRSIEVARVRDPRARRLRLAVDERGARLTMPLRASMVSGDRFLAEHRDWLALQLDRHALDSFPPLLRGDTAALPLRGAMLPLHWTTGRYARLQHDGDTLQFAVPARAGAAALRRALRDFYEAQARVDTGRWLPRYLPSLPRAPARVQFKPMSSQWGSLAPDGTLALDLALVLGRPSAFEYVLVHELCHLIRADHSRGFWSEVEKRFPAWRDERDYFHREGRRLKASLRALTSG